MVDLQCKLKFESRELFMKYIIELIWAFILGHVAYYLGSSLTSSPYNVVEGHLLGLALGVGVIIIASMLKSFTKSNPDLD